MFEIMNESVEGIFHVEKFMFLIRLIEVVPEVGNVFRGLMFEFGLMYEFVEFLFHWFPVAKQRFILYKLSQSTIKDFKPSNIKDFSQRKQNLMWNEMKIINKSIDSELKCNTEMKELNHNLKN